jgi:hypothetical protein
VDVRLDMELDQFRTQISEALANGGTQSLIRLTDEELAVLDPEETLIPKPHLAAMDAQQREWAMATALRSLVARETIEIHNIEELAATLHGAPETAVDMRIRVDVDLALTLRRTADRALAVKQHSAAGTAYAHIHIHAPNLLLIERITAGGMHLFTLADNVQDAVNLIQPLLDPFGVADRNGPIITLDPTALDREHVGPLATVIDNAQIVCELVLLSDPPGPMMTTYATNRAVWTVTVDRPHAPTGITARPVSHATLSASLADMLKDRKADHA